MFIPLHNYKNINKAMDSVSHNVHCTASRAGDFSTEHVHTHMVVSASSQLRSRQEEQWGLAAKCDAGLCPTSARVTEPKCGGVTGLLPVNYHTNWANGTNWHLHTSLVLTHWRNWHNRRYILTEWLTNVTDRMSTTNDSCDRCDTPCKC